MEGLPDVKPLARLHKKGYLKNHYSLKGFADMAQAEILNLALLVITLLLWGTTPLMEKVGLREVDPLIGVFLRSAAVVIVLAVVFLFSGRYSELARVSPKNLALFAGSGIMAGLVAMWTYFYVLKSGMMSQVVPITASYPLVTALLAFLVLGESFSIQRVVGIIMTVTGIIIIKQS